MTTPTFAKTHNLIAYLAKPAESEGFEKIIDFLNGSSVRYALTTSPTIRTSCIKQFWSTAKVKTVNDEVRVQALIDGKNVTIKESSIRRTLRLDDEEGTSCLANDDIFTGLANMGYEKIALVLKPPPGMNLAALWHQQSFGLPQTRSLTSPAGDISHHQDIYDNPSLTKKVFANMKRVGTGFFGVITPLFESMLVQAAEELGEAQDVVSVPTEPSTSKPYKKHKFKKQQPKSSKVPSPTPSPEHQLPSPSNDPLPTAKDNRIQKLEDKVDQLEEEKMTLKEKFFKTTQVDFAAPVENIEKSFKHGRMIADMDADVEINLQEAQAKAYNLDLQHSKKVLSMQDTNEEKPAEMKEVLEVVKDAKLMTQDDVIEQVKIREKQENAVMRYQALKRKPVTEAQERKNMMIYLKNMADFKMNFFKGMTYSKIRHIFEKHYNSIQAFLEKVEDEVTVQEEGNKRQGESLEQETTKKKRMDKEENELKRHLQIVANDDDDVYTEATPLASKVPVVDYQIHHENNKPYYKIIRADGTHKLFLSFITLLKNFHRDDLETLWKIVKERFETTYPENFSDDFLLNIFKIMFEKPNVEANMFLLVEKKYPLTHFTLQQMLDNVRLEVEEESEMSLELLSAAAYSYYC
nr:hypothetical protein [Tanacetum cinerariifolium]